MKNKLTYLALLILFITSISFAQPTLTAPADNSHSSGLTPTFTWTATTGPYTLQISNNGTFAPGDIIFSNAAAVSPYVYGGAPALTYDTQYWWRVTDGLSAVSAIFSFWTVPGAVTLIAPPADGAIGVALNVALSWNTRPSANYYALEVNDDITFVNAAEYTASGNISTAPAAIGLSNGTTYYWRVKASGDAGVNFGAWTVAPRSFTTVYAAPTTQALSIVFSSVATNSMAINWTNGNGTHRAVFMKQTANVESASPVNGNLYTTNASIHFGYGDQIGATGWYCIYNGTGGGPITVDNLAAGYTYRVMVCEYNGDTGTPSTLVYNTNNGASNNPKNQITVPSAPVATTATGMTTTSFSANWGAVTGADSYRIDVGTTPGGTDIKNDFVLGLVTTYSVTTLTPGTPYYYKVRAVNTGGTSVSSNEISTITLTGPPTLTAPVNGLTGVSVLPTLDWDTVTGAATYKVYVDNDSDCLSPFFSTNIGAGTIYTFDATISSFPLTNGTMYYWKVAGVNVSGEGTSSSIYHFKTVPAVDITLSQPSSQGTVYDTSVMFSWLTGQSNSGLKFKLQYIQKDANPAPNEAAWAAGPSAVTPNTTKTIDDLIRGKRYYWRVIVLRDGGINDNDVVSYSSSRYFTIQGGATIVPVPSFPIELATVYTNSPTLYWYLNEAAAGLTYQVKYHTSSAADGNGELTGGTKLPTDVNMIAQGSSNLFKALPDITPGTTWHWQVRAYYADGDAGDNDPSNGTDGWSAWSPIKSFKTQGTGTVQLPIPSYPTDGVTVYTTAPYLYWYLPTAASGLVYDYQIVAAATSGDATTAFTALGGTPTAITPTDQLYIQTSTLTQGLKYYWRVQSRNASTAQESGYTTYTNTYFTVAGGTTATYPVLTWPIGSPAPIVYTTTPTLSWYLEGSSLGLTGYTLKYKKDPAPGNWANALTASPGNANDGQFTITPVSTTSKTLTVPLTYGGHYYWAVATSDGAGAHANYSVGDFTIVGPATAGDPVLSQPSNLSTVYSTSVTFSWFVNGPTTGIDNYTLKFSTSDIFDPSVTTTRTVATQSKSETGLTAGATYYWKVQANYISGSPSGWAGPWSFTINTGSPSIVQPLVGGPNNVTVNTASPTLSWVLQAPTAANSTYEVQLAENPNFQSAKTFSSSKSNMLVSGLVGGKSYFWKVRSRDGTGNTSYYSGTGQFRVNSSVTAVEEEVIPTQFELSQNYPNPFNPTTKISYALPQNSYVSIKVYDMLGREVKALVNNEMLAGNHSINWNGDDNNGIKVASGTYIYRITASNFVAVKKMILIK